MNFGERRADRLTEAQKAAQAATKGDINLTAGTRLYLYIGGARAAGEDNASLGSYNGGGSGIANSSYGSGGGETDLRTVPASTAEPSDDIASLASRIMVAAGGGGANGSGGGAAAHSGGYAGGLTGGGGSGSSVPTGGKQTEGGGSTGLGGQAGSFGKGGSATHTSTTETAGGGGGGWFGGGSGNHVDNNSSGAGGSSYISGFSGCTGTNNLNGFAARTDNDAIEKSKSPTGLFFIADTTQIMDGNTTGMPMPAGGTEEGHTGPGHAKISFVSE